MVDLVDMDGDSVITDDSPSPSQPQASSSRATRTPPPTPNGPICSYGSRLGFTYFAAPAPMPDLLNAELPVYPTPALTEAGAAAGAAGGASLPREVHWFTVDDQLLYLSFFMDSGPLNAACL